MTWRPDQPIAWEEKIVPPTATDDANNGYLVGDIWVDETANAAYVCVDNTAGAAVWEGTLKGITFSSDYGLTFTYTANTLKINTPQDLQAAASPTFATVKLSGLTDNYVPYHVSDAVGLADSPLRSNATAISLGSSPSSSYPLFWKGSKSNAAGGLSYQTATLGGTLTASRTNTNMYLTTTVDPIEGAFHFTAFPIYSYVGISTPVLFTGHKFDVAMTNASGTIDEAFDVYAPMTVAAPANVGRIAPFYSLVTLSSGVTIASSYILYGGYSGPGTVTNKYGVYITGEDKNYLSGELEVGGAIKYVWKVGSYYFNSTGVDPATELGYGTWTQVAQGQFLVGTA